MDLGCIMFLNKGEYSPLYLLLIEWICKTKLVVWVKPTCWRAESEKSFMGWLSIVYHIKLRREIINNGTALYLSVFLYWKNKNKALSFFIVAFKLKKQITSLHVKLNLGFPADSNHINSPVVFAFVSLFFTTSIKQPICINSHMLISSMNLIGWQA